MRKLLQVNSPATTTKRGRVLRVPGDGPGLLMVEGQQFRFWLDELWRSPSPPQAGVIVDVNLSADFQLIAVTAAESAVPPPHIAMRRQERYKAMTEWVSHVGLANLLSLALLIVAWWFLTNVSIELPLVGKLDFTFWQLLGLLNHNTALQAVDPRSGQYSTGFYGVLAVSAACGPFLSQLWKVKRAALGGFLPLIFMIGVTAAVRTTLPHALGGGPLFRYVDAGARPLMLGPGAYLSLLAALALACDAARRYFRSRPATTENRKSAAHAA